MSYEPINPEIYPEILRILKRNPQGLAIFEFSPRSTMRLSDRQWRHALFRMLRAEEVIVVKMSRNNVRYHHPDIPLKANQIPGFNKVTKTKEKLYESDGVFSGEFNEKERYVAELAREFRAYIAPLRAARGPYAAM